MIKFLPVLFWNRYISSEDFRLNTVLESFEIEHKERELFYDIYNSRNGRSIKLINQSVTPQRIKLLEKERPKMIWLIESEFIDRFLFFEKPWGVVFKWKWPVKSLSYCKNSINLDLGINKILSISKWNIKGTGYGKLMTYRQFINELL